MTGRGHVPKRPRGTSSTPSRARATGASLVDWRVQVRRRKQTYEDNRMRPDAGGYVAGGGGGHVAGGGVRSVLDEKKMVKGKPSPRSGPRRPARGLRTRKD